MFKSYWIWFGSYVEVTGDAHLYRWRHDRVPYILTDAELITKTQIIVNTNKQLILAQGFSTISFLLYAGFALLAKEPFMTRLGFYILPISFASLPGLLPWLVLNEMRLNRLLKNQARGPIPTVSGP